MSRDACPFCQQALPVVGDELPLEESVTYAAVAVELELDPLAVLVGDAVRE